MNESRASYQTQLQSPPDNVTIEVTRREAALIRQLREWASKRRDFFVVEITQTGFIWREVGNREG